MIDDIVDPKGFPEFYYPCFAPSFWFVISDLQEPFRQSALTAPILQEKPVSPFNSTDLPLVEFPQPDRTLSCLVYSLGMHC
jgi:hypothetical protein